MLAHWCIYAVAATSLIAAAAVAAEQLFAVWRGPRRGVWLSALVASIALPLFVGARGGIPARQPSAAAPLSSPAHVGDEQSLIATAPASVLPPRGDARTGIARPADPLFNDSRLARLWCVSSAALLALFVTAAARLRRESGAWRSERLDGVDILVAPAVGPAVVGFVRPRIVLPEWTLSLDAASRALILQHEREHVRTGDPYLLLAAALSIIVLPWNLALWFVARRLTLAVELDCDQRVLVAGGSVREYGSVLLEVVSRRHARGLLLGASLIQPRQFLARRIRSMVTDRPRHPRLISLALATAAALLTVAATRLPTPEPLRLGWRATRLKNTHTTTRPSPAPESSRPVASPATRSPRRAGPTPRITAIWENAPIELVVAAFAKFSGKRINLGSDVNGVVTARITDEPWDQALAHIMGVNGYRVIVHPDSSMTISIDRRAPVRPPSDNELQNRPVSGSAIDESTNLPIMGVTVNVIGLQAIGEPNRACTTARGTFQLNVPDGEVWLDANAPGYEFPRVTLGPRDSVASFRGRRTGTRAVEALDGRIESLQVLKGAAATAVYGDKAANGVIVIRTKPDQFVDSAAARLWLRGVYPPKGPTPLLVIDGTVITNRRLDSPPACVSQ